MELHTHLIEKYCDENGQPITISFDIDNITTDVIITRGRYEQNGGRYEPLSFQDIHDILEVNDIYSLMREQLDFFSKELSDGKGDNFNRLQNVESLKYDTLAKYIIQMLNGPSIPQIIYPELIPLPKHKDNYFRETPE